MKAKVYTLSPNCIIVKGYIRCALLDLQFNTILLISKKLSEIISKPISSKELLLLNRKDQRIVIQLIKNEILLLIPKIQNDLFHKLNTQFHNVSEINNIIIELSDLTFNLRSKISKSLDTLNCKFVELRVTKDISVNKLFQFLKLFTTTTIQSINIYFEYSIEAAYLNVIKLKESIAELNSIYVYNLPENFDTNKKIAGKVKVIFLKNRSIAPINCGNISPIYFTINIPFVTEAINYNTCLNCKVSIKKNGDVRHCPSMKKSFFNIKNNDLESVVNENNFIKLGSIKKDQIKTCRDCEFRYVCSDCRAYIEDPKDLYSKPLKCGYDPYTGKWEDWSRNPIKQKAIKYYKMKSLIKI